MRATITALCALSSLAVTMAIAMAGGTHWQVAVELFAEDGEAGKVLVVTSAEKDLFYGVCSRAIIHVVDRPPLLWRIFPNSPPVSDEGHTQALDLLLRAKTSRKAIAFGLIGQGLISKPGIPCEYWSSGLSVEELDEGDFAVYSYYKWP